MLLLASSFSHPDTSCLTFKRLTRNNLKKIALVHKVVDHKLVYQRNFLQHRGDRFDEPGIWLKCVNY